MQLLLKVQTRTIHTQFQTKFKKKKKTNEPNSCNQKFKFCNKKKVFFFPPTKLNNWHWNIFDLMIIFVLQSEQQHLSQIIVCCRLKMWEIVEGLRQWSMSYSYYDLFDLALDVCVCFIVGRTQSFTLCDEVCFYCD